MINLIDTLGSKWNLMIIWNLQEETLRFTKLRKKIGYINSKTLTNHLRCLERYNIIHKVVYPEVPPRVEYSLTKYGKAFLPVFKAVNEWSRSLSSPINLLETLGSKWNLMIIWNLQEETLRFTKLRKQMGDINSKTLTDNLRYLEKHYIIDRVVYPEVPPRVEYSLTKQGKTFLPLLKAMNEWGMLLPPPKK